MLSPRRTSRRRPAALAAVAVALLAAGTAAGAGLTVSAEPSTVIRVTASVPVQTCDAAPVADAGVDEAVSGTGAGADPTVDVRSAGGADRRAYVRFDVAACAIPAAAEIRTATLRLAVVAPPAAGRTLEARRAVEAWTEGGVSWSAQPAVAAAAASTAATGTVAAPVDWDVAGDVRAIVAGSVADEGWRIADVAEDDAVPATVALAAREHADPALRPTLTIRYYR
jgi:hypothetical protein